LAPNLSLGCVSDQAVPGIAARQHSRQLVALTGGARDSSGKFRAVLTSCQLRLVCKHLPCGPILQAAVLAGSARDSSGKLLELSTATAGRIAVEIPSDYYACVH
jgi:hypothetical protein